MTLEGSLQSVKDLQILHDANLKVYDTASINSYASREIRLNSLRVFNAGKFTQYADNRRRAFRVFLDADFHVYAGGIASVNAVYVNATDIRIDISGLLSAVGRGYQYGTGPGSANGSLTIGGSGGGHGGTGGVGYGQSTAGAAYGSFMRPIEHGSGGGFGHKRLVSIII